MLLRIKILSISAIAAVLVGCGGGAGSEIEDLFNDETVVTVSMPVYITTPTSVSSTYKTADDLVSKSDVFGDNNTTLKETKTSTYMVQYEDTNSTTFDVEIQSDGQMKFSSKSGDIYVKESNAVIPSVGNAKYYYMNLAGKMYQITIILSAASSSSSSSKTSSSSSSSSSKTSSSSSSSSSVSSSVASSSSSSACMGEDCPPPSPPAIVIGG